MKFMIFLALFFILFFSFAEARVVINEVEANPAGTDSGNEWIELLSDSAQNLTGWYITNKDGENYTSEEIIENFLVLDSLSGLDNTGQNLRLFNQYGILQDETGFFNDTSNNNKTFSRVPDFTGNFIFQNGTKGFPNEEAEIKNKSISPACIKEGQDTKLSAVVKGYCIEEAAFSVKLNNSWENYTGIKTGEANYSYIINGSLINGGETVEWTVYARDCLGREFNDGAESFYVIKKTKLNIFPGLPDGLNEWYINEPHFTIENSDALNASEIFYRWDSLETINYTGIFGLENSPNQGNVSGGVLELNYWSDTACGKEQEHRFAFKSDFTNPLIEDLIPENNSIIKNTFKPEISAYLEEIWGGNSGINKNKTFMELDGALVPANITDADSLDALISYTPGIDLTNGAHEAYVYAEDNSGRNSSLSWKFAINFSQDDFNFSVFSPQNKIYGNKKVPFNITTSKIVEEISYINHNDNNPKWKILCKNCKKYGFSIGETQTFKEGENNITARAINEFGITKEKNIVFTVDSKLPKISKTLPREKSFTNGSEFYIKYTEENLKEITLFYGNKTDIRNISKTNCEKGKNKECVFSADLEEFEAQLVEYWLVASDFVNSAESGKIEILADTTSPDLNILSVSGTYEKKIFIDITASEEAKLEYFDLEEENPRWKKLCGKCSSYEKNKTFGKGFHNLTIRALDKAGNSDQENLDFWIG